MKKALALIMAIAMIASMAAVSMAATEINPTLNGSVPVGGIKIDGQIYDFNKTTGYAAYADDDNVVFGKTVYIPFVNAGFDYTTDGLVPSLVGDGYVTDSDAVKGLNVTAKWTKGGEYVKSVEIVKAGNVAKGQVYAIAIATTGSSLESVDVAGEIAVKGKSYYEVVNGTKLEGKKADVKFDFDVELILAYEPGTVAATISPEDKAVYNFTNTALEEVVINYGELSAEVSTKGMKKVLLAYNDDVNEDIFDAYIDADLVFINCEGSFRRTAEVTVDATDYPYFYEVVDGKLVAMDAEYDDWTEEFTFKTKTLGNYVLSDTELVVEEVAVANPSTGAAA